MSMPNTANNNVMTPEETAAYTALLSLDYSVEQAVNIIANSPKNKNNV